MAYCIMKIGRKYVVIRCLCFKDPARLSVTMRTSGCDCCEYLGAMYGHPRRVDNCVGSVGVVQWVQTPFGSNYVVVGLIFGCSIPCSTGNGLE